MVYFELPILDVAVRCGIIVPRGSTRVEVETNCPFCNDRKRHLSLNTAKNQFNCHRCGESGNSVSLYAKVHRVDNKTAFKELIAGFNREIPPQVNKPLPVIQEATLKPLSNRHDVYYDMLQMLNLSAAHHRQLLSRGLSEAVIKRNMYRTAPKEYSPLYNGILRHLAAAHDLSGIPGFYQRNGRWRMAVKKGMFIPVCTQHGYIQGLQIRLDSIENRKYRWFSSSNYNGGTRINPCIHVANWNNKSTVYITEGALKAETASYLMGDACVIGIAGVNCISGLAGLLNELGVREVIEAFDMDKLTNPHVAKALLMLKEIIRRAGVKYRSAKWNPTYKGIDDFYLALRRNNLTAAA